MGSVIQQIITDQVIKYDEVNKGFECLICDVKLSGEPSALDHLKSKQHREIGARYAIKNLRSSPKSLLDLLPDSVKDAAEAGDISIMNLKGILCHICNSPNTGVLSLETHLLSSSHIKKRDSRPQLEVPSPRLNLTFTNPAVQQAISENIVNYINPNEFCCCLCDLKFSGEISLEQHLESKKHREAGARLAISNFRTAPRSLIEKLPSAVKDAVQANIVTVTDSREFKCTVCNVSLNGVVSLNDHLVGDDHKKKKDVTQMINSPPCQIPIISPVPGCTSPSSVPAYTPTSPVPANTPPSPVSVYTPPSQINTQLLHDNPDIARALTEGIVILTDSKLDPFCCKLCDKKFNSDGPLVDHLKSKKHLHKEKMYLDSRALLPPAKNVDLTSEASVSEKTPGTPKKKYSVISDIRGHVYVFNYTFKGTSKSRKGAEHDSKNLYDTFTKMGYEVYLHEDLTGEETDKTLEKIRRKSELNGIDSFIMLFLSHGLDEYTFLANDEDEMNLQLIRRRFTDRKCPYLRGKPKVFLVNYCRGDQLQKKEIEYDSIEAPNDMVTIHAATEGIMARRSPTNGTIFVASLCEVLKEHARDLDLRDIYHVLEDKMKERQGTKPMWEDYGFKPFSFNPI